MEIRGKVMNYIYKYVIDFVLLKAGRANLYETHGHISAFQVFHFPICGLYLIYYIVFQVGRGVPVIIPREVVEPLKLISRNDIRSKVGVLDSNPYLFAKPGLSIYTISQCAMGVYELTKCANIFKKYC